MDISFYTHAYEKQWVPQIDPITRHEVAANKHKKLPFLNIGHDPWRVLRMNAITTLTLNSTPSTLIFSTYMLHGGNVQDGGNLDGLHRKHISHIYRRMIIKSIGRRNHMRDLI